MAIFADMNTWTDELGHTGLRSFTDKDRHFWLEQNRAKKSKWAKLARKGHDMAWGFASPGGSYTAPPTYEPDGFPGHSSIFATVIIPKRYVA